MKRPITTAFALGTLLTLTGVCTTAGAGSYGHRPTYDVTVTNVTHGVTFTPLLVVSHRAASDLLFTPGDAPSGELAALAEAGDVVPLAGVLSSNPRVLAIDEGTSGMLAPGESVTVTIQAVPGRGYISLAAMLLPTNDGMAVSQNVRVPVGKNSTTAWAYGFDAGSELNDEDCENIPGPHCGGNAGSPDDVSDEGYVHIHPGIQGVGDLAPGVYDWRNPVARVTVKRTQR